MSAKRPLEIFSGIGVTGNGLRRHLNQPIAGLTLLTFFTVAVPAPGRAQIPLLPPPPNLPTSPDVQLPNIPGSPTGVPDVPLPAPVQPPGRPACDRSALPPESAYTLGPGDRLRVDVFDVTEYSGEYAVLVDGTLNLPIVGTLSVRGLTLQQATQLISSQYARFVRRPIITLSLLGTRPIIFAIAGEVNRPGTYTLTPNQALGGGGTQGAVQTGQFPTVTQALTLAGGITQAAEVCQVQLRRRATASNPARVYTVNLWNLLQGNLNQDVTLRDGDTIFIPAVTAINPAETRQLADASFSARDVRPINVTVVGEVGRPGPYSVSGGGEATGGATGAVTGNVTGAPAAGGGGAGGGPPTLTKAIQVAGGITALADVRAITVRRITRLQGVREIRVNLWDLLRQGDVNQDITLQEGDTITVPTATALDPAEATQLAGASFAPNTIVVNVVGEVVRAGAIPVPPNTPLNQAVLAAGGFNTRAKKRTVELIRLNPNGTVEKREIQVDLAQGINTEGNPTLRNNDVVVVKRSTLAAVGDTLGTILNPVGSFVNLLRLFGF